MPRPLRALALKHRELLKFAVVGGTCFIIDTAIFTVLKMTFLEPKPVTAKVVATLIATIVSYVLNREWSFRTRGGRERAHEAALFFLVNGVSIVINSAPLWASRYVLDLQEPAVTRLTQEIADFTSAQIIGTLLGMVFRWWSYKKWVFPEENARPRLVRVPTDPDAEAYTRTRRGSGGSAGRAS
ncbi:putative flippase GtrA (transmembrane translocase of bactoprenol-linked glucose) [Goodfellowiella coeruleoviolacea]|uniref:Flippase GtrA (Transmembrane translocase of bactoprenol-linked glucose) n=2 Tax=Goodfellowiella coeruleoviolacea TaxID=334858 RepID=A0AAE3GKP2_9PSEU|nr:putative flippase GtrA (transmembrane translocase of bactoprenol-linked glucose) [Goodfellowiella coeruleoviolacea]